MELLNVCIRNGKTAEAPGILMIRIGEELAAVCAGYYQHAELPTLSCAVLWIACWLCRPLRAASGCFILHVTGYACIRYSSSSS